MLRISVSKRPISLVSPPVTSGLDENPSHGLRGGGKEMAAAVPMPSLLRIHQPEIHLVNQGRRLERLPGLFLGHFRRRQFAQLVVDQRQEVLSGRGVALFDGRQYLGDIGHGRGFKKTALSEFTDYVRRPTR